MAARKDGSELAEVISKSKELNIPLTEGAKRFGVNVKRLYNYNRKQKRVESKCKSRKSVTKDNESVVECKISNCRHSKLPEEIQEIIRSYRRNNPTYGFRRISDLLKQKYLIVITRKEIRNVLKEAGLLELCDSSFDKEPSTKGTRRFEAASPGDMWQMDVTYVYIRKLSVFYLVVIVDDHSRFCIGAKLCRDQRADTLISVLHDACTMYGAPKKLLTDQGSGFYSWSRNNTVFQQYLDDLKIEHIVGAPHSPQSQGKVERLIQTIRKEHLTKVKFTGFADAADKIKDFAEQYNFERPHQGIGGKCPSDRFHGVTKELDHVESDLVNQNLDLSQSYVIYKVQDHRICINSMAEGLKVYLDGKLLKHEDANEEF